MKKLIVAGFAFAAMAVPAIAADLPAKMYTKAPVATAVNWTGCYVGLNAGYGWGKDSVGADGFPGGEGEPRFRGGMGGAQIGCDYQFARSWVVGVEAKYDFASLKGDVIDPSNLLATTTSKYSGLGALSARLGYAFDRSLVYATGGLGYSRSERSLVDNPFTFSQSTGTTSKWGWMLGAGWEYMIVPNWSAKLEYNHYDFGKFSESVTQQPGGAVFLQDDRNKGVDVVMIGVNWRFR